MVLQVVPVEPTASLSSVVAGLPVRLRADPITGKDFVEVDDASALPELTKRCRFYGYSLQESVMQADFLYETSYEKSLREAVNAVVHGEYSLNNLVEEVLLLEGAAVEVERAVEKTLKDMGVPDLRTKQDAAEFLQRFIFTNEFKQGLNLPNDASPDEIVRALLAAVKHSLRTLEQEQKRLEQELEVKVKGSIIGKIGSAIYGILRALWRFIVGLAKRVVNLLFLRFHKSPLLMVIGVLMLVPPFTPISPYMWFPAMMKFIASLLGATGIALEAVFGISLGIVIAKAVHDAGIGVLAKGPGVFDKELRTWLYEESLWKPCLL